MGVSFLFETDTTDEEKTSPHGRDQIAHDSPSTQSIKACNQKDHRYDTQSGSDASVGEWIGRARRFEEVDDIARLVNLGPHVRSVKNLRREERLAYKRYGSQ